MDQLYKTLLLLGILLCPILCNAQDNRPDIILPYDIAVEVYAELKEKDNLVVILNKQDSIVTLYEQQKKGLIREVQQRKLQASEYKTTISKLEALVKVQDGKLLDLDNKNRKNKKRLMATVGIVVVETVLLVIALL